MTEASRRVATLRPDVLVRVHSVKDLTRIPHKAGMWCQGGGGETLFGQFTIHALAIADPT